ncbi:uncharacterized protein FOMMEDRAFT_29367 [Fomitiporia mediterranea MF3/22]|uniref:uncharacterized protein n=1 Tax=Fomitiporia mediterranea (strain MF3/22) TaxID=694068 RepID=UPI000440826F|nr:uncharacterized protein FOMMEDRAFT_29367 [Fomitiporia mediterranea MF3/22]EJD02321.1 hypothetical protein FOMMEDRAFT_29367 [Fomitiporia mediterranea MF3/22]
MTNLKDLFRAKLRKNDKHLGDAMGFPASDPFFVSMVKDARSKGTSITNGSDNSSESVATRGSGTTRIFLAAKCLLASRQLKRPKIKRSQSLPGIKIHRCGRSNLLDPLRRKHRPRPLINKTLSEADIRCLRSDKAPLSALYKHRLREYRLLKQERILKTNYRIPPSSLEGRGAGGTGLRRGLGIPKHGDMSKARYARKNVSEPAGVCMTDFSYISPDIVSPALQEELRLKGYTRSVLGRILGPNRRGRISSAGMTPPYRDIDPLDEFGRSLSRSLALGLYGEEFENGESLEEYVESIPSRWWNSILAIPCPIRFGRNQLARRWTMAFYLFLTSLGFLFEAVALSFGLLERRRRGDFGAKPNTKKDATMILATAMTMGISLVAIYVLFVFWTQVEWALGRRTAIIYAYESKRAVTIEGMRGFQNP